MPGRPVQHGIPNSPQRACMWQVLFFVLEKVSFCASLHAVPQSI